MTATVTGTWMDITGWPLACLPAEVRHALLARACLHLILLSVVLTMDGPGAAGMLYASRCGTVRLGPDGGIEVWCGP